MKARAELCLDIVLAVMTGFWIAVLMVKTMIWTGISTEYLGVIRWGISSLLLAMRLHKLINRMMRGRRINRVTFVMKKKRKNKLAFIMRNWQPPPLGWVKINVDASFQQGTGRATVGGLVRDERGTWITGFQARAASCSAVRAELMAIWKGLWLAKQKGFRRVIIELDSSEAFELLLLQEEEDETRPNFDIIRSFCALMEKGCEYEFCNVLGEANLCADLMAQEAWQSACDEEFIQSPPASVQKEMEKDFLNLKFRSV